MRLVARLAGVLPAALCLGLVVTTAALAAPRADIVAYGDHVPGHTLSGGAFVNPFDNREDGNDPYTRVVVEEVPGLKHPLGSIGWAVVALGKYVLTGNYDEGMRVSSRTSRTSGSASSTASARHSASSTSIPRTS